MTASQSASQRWIKSDNKSGNKKDAKAKPDGKLLSAKPAAKSDGASTTADPGCRRMMPGNSGDLRPVIEPEKSAHSPNGLHEFREKRWVELYKEKIEEMTSVLKSKGVPVLWVGLPVVRGPKATADTAFLDTLYREAAGKAGITYVDVWDGFVDEAGRFLQQGLISKGESAGCAPAMACTSPRPARLSWRITSSAKSTVCWRRVPHRLYCPPNRQRPMPNALPDQPRRRVRWLGRSFPWRPPLSAPTNCSAVRELAAGDARCASSAGLGQR